MAARVTSAVLAHLEETHISELADDGAPADANVPTGDGVLRSVGASPITDVPPNSDLTIIITTSPIRAHPSTELMEKVISSFRHVNGLDQCPVLLVCDGSKVAAAYRPKVGKVTKETRTAYEEYKRRLKVLCQSGRPVWNNTALIELPSHHGFGLAVKHCIDLVETEFVLVVQHDHPFRPTASFSTEDVLRFMASHPANYVHIPMGSAFRHVNKCASEYGIPTREMAVNQQDGSRYIPILFWWDATHFARTATYREAVFSADTGVKQGCFIEDTYGHELMSLLKQDFATHFPRYRLYMYVGAGGEVGLTSHLDGRKYVADAQRPAHWRDLQPC